MEKNIQEILTDLYQIDPSLKKLEPQLVKVINEFMAARPDTKFNEQFKKELYHQLMAKAEELKNTYLKKNPVFHFRKKIYYSVGALIIMVIFIVPTIYLLNNQKPADGRLALNITPTTENAFGRMPLAEEQAALSGNAVGTPSGVKGFGGGGYANDASMPNPFGESYTYSYRGDGLEIAEDKMAVLKREKQGFTDAGFGNLVKNMGSGLFDLSKFGQPEITNISFNQNTDYGYSFYIDLSQGLISISQNWQTWPQCYNQKCFEEKQLTIDQMPSDEQLIKIADEFINNYNFNMSNYGQPQVSKQWLINYELSTNKEEYYVPDTMTVIYPLIIDGKTVYEESGYPYGLSVNINIYEKNKVSGAYNITSQNYQSSLYSIQNDEQQIIKMAEKGGLYSNYYNFGTAATELKLDTPELAYVKIWQPTTDISQGTNELLIPALIFPIIDPPTKNGFYKKNVIVPLVEQLTNNNDMPVRIMDEGI